ncbi:MAG: ubiquitin-conjugating enzyme E2 [Acidobacteriota bacterium]
MNARTRRLMADYLKIQDEFTGHPNIKVLPLEGEPPTRYLISYYLKGIRWDNRLQRPVETDFHQAEIYLHRDYPRLKPRCIMKTEIFHPNFGDWICVGDYWAAGETMADIIIRIGEMIQYQKYNNKSPVNVAAARWARENERLFPIGTVNLYQAEARAEIVADGPKARNGSLIDIDVDQAGNMAVTHIKDDFDIELI